MGKAQDVCFSLIAKSAGFVFDSTQVCPQVGGSLSGRGAGGQGQVRVSLLQKIKDVRTPTSWSPKGRKKYEIEYHICYHQKCRY